MDQGWLFFKGRLLFGLRMCLQSQLMFILLPLIYKYICSFWQFALKKSSTFSIWLLQYKMDRSTFCVFQLLCVFVFFPHFSKYLTEIVVRYVSLYKSKQPKSDSKENYQKDNLTKFKGNPLRSYLTILKHQTSELSK